MPLPLGCKRRRRKRRKRKWRRRKGVERGGEGKEERKEEEKIKGVAGLVGEASAPGGPPEVDCIFRKGVKGGEEEGGE